MGRLSTEAGRDGSWEGSKVKFGCNDGEGRGSSGEAMDGISEGESSPRCRVHRGRGGAGGRMVSASNEQRSRRYAKENENLCQVKELVERQHQRKKKVGSGREKVKTELGGGYPGEGRAPAVDLAVQAHNVERLLTKP
jgi:hypothetical protein